MIEPADYSDTIQEHSHAVYRTCCRYTNSPDAAWDAYQETFLVLTRKHYELNLESSIGPWLRETARRCSLSVVRDRSRHRGRALATDVQEDRRRCPADASLSDLKDLLSEEVSELPDDDQRLLHLLYVEELTHREAADSLKIPRGSVHARSTHVHERLRRRLRKRGAAVGFVLLLFLLNTSSNAAAESAATMNSGKSFRGRQIGPLATVGALIMTIFCTSAIVDPGLISSAAQSLRPATAVAVQIDEEEYRRLCRHLPGPGGRKTDAAEAIVD